MNKIILQTFVVAAASIFFAFPAKADVSSTFDTGIDGWTLANADPGSTLMYEATGGNPGGYILFTDGAEGAYDVFSAPSKFLGDDSAYYNQSLSFDLLTSATADALANNPLTLTDGAGDSISLILSAPTVNIWTSYTYALNTSSGFIFDGGAAATQQQIQAVLANVTSIHIPADVVYNGPATTTMGLDNVVLGVAVPEPSVWALLATTLVLLPLGRRFFRRAC